MFSSCGFDCLRKFLRILVMFGNDELSKLVLIISDSSDSDCFAATFIELMWSVYYYNAMLACTSERMAKIGGIWFLTPWQINLLLAPKRRKLFMKTSFTSRYFCSLSFFDTTVSDRDHGKICYSHNLLSLPLLSP